MTKVTQLFEISIKDDETDFTTSIDLALKHAEEELFTLNENNETLKNLKPECDKLDYSLAASSGVLCGIIDIFLVGKPDDSLIGENADKWFCDRTISFAKICGWKPRSEENTLHNAIAYLERRFKVPYDQTTIHSATKEAYGINSLNHHFKSLAHNPTLLGLFFSILDQFANTSHFVLNEKLYALQKADDNFMLKGNHACSKIIYGIINWFGHIISDISGASKSKGRGMGIPSPIWTWINDLSVLRSKLNIPPTELLATITDLAVEIYKEGFDIRFQLAQTIPVIMNELLVRLMYSTRRLFKYYSETDKSVRSAKLMWQKCEPFKNPTVKRMLTVAHGAFCLLDISEATIRGFVAGEGHFNPVEFFLRINVAGVGRFTISLYGEFKRCNEIKREHIRIERETLIIEDYIDGLKALAVKYDDSYHTKLIADLINSNAYKEYKKTFDSSAELAKQRGVPAQKILTDKEKINIYFKGEEK